MVKYADRGLLVHGSVSPLFETLYFVVCVTLFSVFSVFTLYKFLDSNPTYNYHLMCIQQSADPDFESMKSITLFFALSFPFFVIFISMFCSILHYLRSRKKSNIIGHYRRNILSLKETVFYAIFILVLLLFHSTVMKFHHYFGFSANGLRLFSFTYTLLVHQLCEGIIFPFYILWNLYETMPEFYSDETESGIKFVIVGQWNLEPENKIKVRTNPVIIITQHYTSNASLQNQTKSYLPDIA